VNIIVCVKQVPDSWAEKTLTAADSTLDRDSADAVMNELDEYAVEEALRIQAATGGPEASPVTILTMGPAKAGETIRKALSMGADAGVHVMDDALHGTDALGTSLVLAKALGTLSWDLVLMGTESTDARMAVVPAMLAERLGVPQLTFAGKVDVDPAAGLATIQRQTEVGYDTVVGALPAVVSVVEKINEPRYPSFKGIMAAKKKPVTALTLADLGVSADEVGLAGAWSQVTDFAARPAKQAGTVVKDEGDGAVKLAEFLAANKFI
jgi:electron transfer flavoprotein beta subunit